MEIVGRILPQMVEFNSTLKESKYACEVVSIRTWTISHTWLTAVYIASHCGLENNGDGKILQIGRASGGIPTFILCELFYRLLVHRDWPCQLVKNEMKF